VDIGPVVLHESACYDNLRKRKAPNGAHLRPKFIQKKVMEMKALSNEALIDSYLKAVDLKLDREFVMLLLAEIKRRKLKLYPEQEAKAN
jgi:developmental checkpoint coupling sporulation initiation to replication initiation